MYICLVQSFAIWTFSCGEEQKKDTGGNYRKGRKRSQKAGAQGKKTGVA